MYLLDTHTLLWWLIDPGRLSAAARDTIRERPHVFVSAASTWEITIKQALGKLSAPDDLTEQVAAARFPALPITIPHTLAVGRLPAHHQDPFDRLLVAQAVSEELTLITRDAEIMKYPVAVLPA